MAAYESTRGTGRMGKSSAQVIRLPGAKTEPVRQEGRAGRYPKKVVRLFAYFSEKRGEAAARDEQQKLIAHEVAMLLHLESVDVRARAGRAWRLSRLTSAPKSTKERLELAEIIEDIKFNALPYEDRQRIEAIRAGRGQVVLMPLGPDHANV